MASLDKQPLTVALDKARADLSSSGAALHETLDIPERLKRSVGDRSFAWVGGATLAGFLLSRIGLRSATAARVTRVSKGNPGIAALLLGFGQVIFGLIRPALMTWLKTKALTGLQSHLHNRAATWNARRNSAGR